MRGANLKAVEAGERPDYQGQKIQQFSNYLALVIQHPKASRHVKDAIASVLVDTISNASGYAWDTDPEGIRFMLPRLLNHMNELFGDGIIEATAQIIDELLPERLGRDLWVEAGKGGESDA